MTDHGLMRQRLNSFVSTPGTRRPIGIEGTMNAGMYSDTPDENLLQRDLDLQLG